MYKWATIVQQTIIYSLIKQRYNWRIFLVILFYQKITTDNNICKRAYITETYKDTSKSPKLAPIVLLFEHAILSLKLRSVISTCT